MKKLLWTLAFIFVAIDCFAQVPYRIAMVQSVADADPVRFRCAHTPQACGHDFIKVLACELHKVEPRFGLNGKRGSTTDISYDAINFKGEGTDTDPDNPDNPSGKATVIDVIGGAGGPSPVVAWFSVTNPALPTKARWIKPCGATQPPTAKPYPGDEVFDAVGLVLFLDYTEAGQAPNIGMGRWFGRTIFDWLAGNTKTLQESIDKHRSEWRAALGLPPVP